MMNRFKACTIIKISHHFISIIQRIIALEKDLMSSQKTKYDRVLSNASNLVKDQLFEQMSTPYHGM